MESCWNFVSYAHIIVQMMVMGYVLYRFAMPFMQNKKGAVCTGIVYFATMLFLYFVPLEINNFAAYGIGIVTAFLVMYRTDRRNFRQKIFIAVTFFAVALAVCIYGGYHYRGTVSEDNQYGVYGRAPICTACGVYCYGNSGCGGGGGSGRNRRRIYSKSIYL